MNGRMHDMFETLRVDSARMAGRVQQSVSDAAEAITRGDARMARDVIATDSEIDTAEVEIERAAIDLLCLYRPLAGEFRLTLMTLKVNAELERIADCAGNAAGQVMSLLADAERVGGSYGVSGALVDLAAAADGMCRDVIRAYNFADADAAAVVIRGDGRLDALYEQVLQEAQAELRGTSDRRVRQLAYIMAAKNLERIGDHCTNIAEHIVYLARGELVRHRIVV